MLASLISEHTAEFLALDGLPQDRGIQECYQAAKEFFKGKTKANTLQQAQLVLAFRKVVIVLSCMQVCTFI